jgi:5'(3')-deoxyribonucleotidase
MKKLERLIDLLVLEDVANPDINVFFDADGVLADFDGRIEQSKNLRDARIELKKWLLQKPELANLHKDDIKGLLKGPQADPYFKKLKKLFYNANELVYAIAGQPGFFFNLDLMPGAKEMVLAVTKIIGKKPNILTAPMESSKNCEEEKRLWFEKHFSGLYNQFICTQEKYKFAKSKYDILIDDRPKYVNKFRDAGGTAILHTDPDKTIRELETIISSLQKDSSSMTEVNEKNRELEEINAMGTGAVVGYTLPLGMKQDQNIMNVGKEKKDKRKREKRWYDVKHESNLSLKKVFLSEAAKSITDLPEDVKVIVEKSFTDEIRVYFSNNSAGINGSVSIKQPTHSNECLNAFIVTDSGATKGFGPLLYDIAIEVAGNKGVSPDRVSVSKSASAVWEYYYNNRPDITKTPLDDRDNPKTLPKEDDCDFHASRAQGSISFISDTPEIKRPWLNYVYYSNGQATIEKLKKANKIEIDI